MARPIDSKCKLCRRAGDKLFLKGERCASAKCAIVKRNYPPGLHGPKGRKKTTDYALRLNEKQKAKRTYQILERQFRLTFDRAKREKGNTAENFIRLLELRLDNAVYRMGLCTSRALARQLVNHGLITVNNRRVTIPSYSLKTGDVVGIAAGKRQSAVFGAVAERYKSYIAPSWLNIDTGEKAAKVLGAPTMETVKPNFDLQLIIEYYSR
jgi:small subunit ribosomal protein S4